MKKFLILFLILTTPCFASSEKLMIQVQFREDTKHGEYSDCLYFTPEEWSDMKPETLAASKQARVDNWINVIENPAPVVEPTKEQMEAEKIAVEEQLLSLQARKVELTDKISEISICPVEEPIE